MINVGIIGCGNIAWKWDKLGSKYFNTHAKAYYKIPDVCLKACCDTNFINAKGLVKMYPSATPYKDYKDMLLKEKLDMVSICASTNVHYEILEYILEKTNIKYIFAEKPLTCDIKQTKNIISLARRRKVYILVDYLRRFDTTLLKLRHIARDGLGQFQLGRVIYYGGFKRNALHLVDFLLFLGLELKFAGFLSELVKFKDDFASSLLFKTKLGKLVYFHWLNEKKYPCLEIDLFYEKARIRVGDYSDVEIFRVRKSTVYPDFRELVLENKIPSTICKSMKNSVDYFIREYKNKKISFISLEKELRLMKLTRQIEQCLN